MEYTVGTVDGEGFYIQMPWHSRGVAVELMEQFRVANLSGEIPQGCRGFEFRDGHVQLQRHEFDWAYVPPPVEETRWTWENMRCTTCGAEFEWQDGTPGDGDGLGGYPIYDPESDGYYMLCVSGGHRADLSEFAGG